MLFFNRKIRRSRLTGRSTSPIEALEQRALLAGDLAAKVVRGDLILEGDRSANKAEISVVDGDVVVTGIDGTTINGEETFTAFSGTNQIPDDLVMRLGGGSDEIVLDGGLDVNDTIDARLDSGANTFSVIDVTARNLFIRGAGANTVYLSDQTTIEQDFVVRFKGNGADTIALMGADIGDDVSIAAGHGENNIALDGANVGDVAKVSGGKHNDNLYLKDSNVRDDLSVKTSRGVDFVMLDGSEVSDKTGLNLGAGNDHVRITNESRLGRGIRTTGGSGQDTVEYADDTRGGRRFASAELNEVEQDVVDERLDGPNGVNTRVAEAEEMLADLLKEGELTVDVRPGLIAEGSVTNAVATLTVDQAPSVDLVVDVTSSNTDAATVPATVTIPAGSTSITFDVDPTDDDVVDAQQSTTITVSAPRYDSDSDGLRVDDDDTLELTVNQTGTNETGSNITATVTRGSATTNELVVTVTNGDDTEVDAPTTVTIPAGASSADFTISPIADGESDGDQTVTISVSGTGHSGDSVDVTINDDDRLTLSLDETEVSEADGIAAATGTVSRAGSLSGELVVTLTSSDTTAATVPATVIIPDGQATVTFDIAAIDDLAENDGTQTVTLTASATGLTDGTATLDVTNDDVLTLALDDAVFAEGSDPVTATITRSGSIDAELVVSLSSQNVNELTVPATVTIAAGNASATFLVTPEDDIVADGPVSVTIDASGTGYEDGSVVARVTNNDKLELRIDKDAITESDGAGAARGNVRRLGPTDEELVVTLLTESPTSDITFPATVTIPAGERRVFFDIDAVDNSLDDGTREITLVASAQNQTSSRKVLDVVDDTGLTLTFTDTNGDPITSIGEGDGAEAVIGTVTREGSTDSELVVTMTSSDTTELTVINVTIGSGNVSASFPIDAVDDDLADLTQTVTITASADGLSSGTIALDVLDDDAAIDVSGSQNSISEDGGTSTITLTRNTDATEELTVDITESTTGLTGVPSTVTFAAGDDTASFDVVAINDAVVQGDRTVTISASVDLHATGTTDILILDDEAQLTLTVADTLVAEGFGAAGTTATVRRNTPTDVPLTVTLISNNLSELTVPPTVVIPAGAEEVTFDVDVEDDSNEDGLQIATLSASAAGHASAQAEVQVNDNDTATIRLTPSSRLNASGSFDLTRDEDFVIAGLTAPNAVVNFDLDNDGDFSDDSTTADAKGSFSYTATLPAGQSIIDVQTDDLDGGFEDERVAVHRAVGTVVRFASNQGDFDVELLDDDAPVTVANFLNYLERYTDSVIHRAPQEFVIQGGGFFLDDNDDIQSVDTDAPIQNEFDSDNSNVRGTLSMALLGGQPNSGTSGWFVNTVDNSFLDGAFHTVFGTVIADGMLVVDRIQGLDINDLSASVNGAFGEAPVLRDFGTDLTGTVSGGQGSTVVVGTGTLFTTELQLGDYVKLNDGQIVRVSSIQSDTQFSLGTRSLRATVADSPIELGDETAPDPSEFVIFSSISEILDDL